MMVTIKRATKAPYRIMNRSQGGLKISMIVIKVRAKLAHAHKHLKIRIGSMNVILTIIIKRGRVNLAPYNCNNSSGSR